MTTLVDILVLPYSVMIKYIKFSAYQVGLYLYDLLYEYRAWHSLAYYSMDYHRYDRCAYDDCLYILNAISLEWDFRVEMSLPFNYNVTVQQDDIVAYLDFQYIVPLRVYLSHHFEPGSYSNQRNNLDTLEFF